MNISSSTIPLEVILGPNQDDGECQFHVVMTGTCCHFGTAGLRIHNSKRPGTSVKINSLSYLSTLSTSGYLKEEDDANKFLYTCVRTIKLCRLFYVLLTAHLSIILVINQLDAQNPVL